MAFRSGLWAVKEVVMIQVSVRRSGALIAVFHIEEVDAIVFFGFAAAGEEEVGVVAHIGVGGPVTDFER